jgi:ABC-type glycerol-3-phosphate transport system substrate-binding protein
VADDFLEALAVAVSDPHSRLRLVVTLRADFYDRPLQHAAFGELLRDAVISLAAMSADEIERAIADPARRVGVTVERALVAEMVAHVAGQPAALPLLQYALTELFDHRQDHLLTLDSYRMLGGVQGALVARAEALYQQMSGPAQSAVRQVFLRLVVLEEGVEVARRRVNRTELSSMRLEGGLVDQVLDDFARARLLTFDRDRVTRVPTVEVAHEALLHRWERLAGWIRQATEDVKMHRRLVGLVRDWVVSDRDNEFLLAPGRLDQFSEWERQSEVTLTEDERDFLDASQIHRARSERQALERVAHERHLERKAGTRLRLLVWVMGIAATIGLVLTAVALDRAAAARRESARAEAVGLSTAAIANSEQDPQLAVYLGLQAVQAAVDAGIPVPPESESALHMALQAAGITYPLVDGPVQVAAGLGGSWAFYRLPLQQLTELASAELDGLPAADQCLLYLGQRGCPPVPEFSLSDDAPSEPGDIPEKPLAGTRVTTRGLSPGDADRGLLAALAEFRDRTGISVVLDSRPGLFGQELSGDPETGPIADLIFLYRPNDLSQLAGDARLVEIGGYLDPDQLATDFSPHLLSLGSVDGRFFAGTWNAGLKSTIWYPVKPFQESGYRVPTTWEEMMALSRQIVVDGGTPWCVGDESDDATGWPATDWIEDILLHAEGPEVYDDWVNHRIPFDHPAVVRAATRLGEIYFTEGFVLGGAAGALTTPWYEPGRPLLRNPPDCWLWHFPTFAVNEVFSDAQVFTAEVDFFPFPSIDPQFKDVAVGWTSTVVALRDAPEVREVVRFLLGSDWGPGWAVADPLPFQFPVNRRFPVPPALDEFGAKQMRQLRAALTTDGFRFDGSDLMPPEVGTGSFWRGMADYIASGPDSLSRVLAEIEASWPDN